MRAEEKTLAFLGLKKHDRRVLAALSQKEHLSIAEISRLARVPRTTTKEALMRLHERGLIRQLNNKGRTLWKRPSASALERHLVASAQLLGAYSNRDESLTHIRHAVHAKEKIDIEVVHGMITIMKMYAQAYAGEPYERVILTQFASGFNAVHSKIPLSYLKELNDIAARHKNILEVIITENTKKEYARLAHKDHDWAPNAAQRMVDVSVVPDTLFPDQKSELLIFRNTVMLTDWEAETAIIVRNEQLAKMLTNFFRATTGQGTTFDNASFLTMLHKTLKNKPNEQHTTMSPTLDA